MSVKDTGGASPGARIVKGMPRKQCCMHHVLFQAVSGICHLPAASRVAALIDGVVMLLDEQTLEGHPLPGIKVCLAASYLYILQIAAPNVICSMTPSYTYSTSPEQASSSIRLQWLLPASFPTSHISPPPSPFSAPARQAEDPPAYAHARRAVLLLPFNACCLEVQRETVSAPILLDVTCFL